MKKFLILICVLFSIVTMNAQKSPVGIWNTGKDNTKIKITKVNGVYEGKIISSDNVKAKIGKLLLKGIQSVNGEWKGKLFAVKKGKWMDTILIEKGNRLLITVKAGWMRKTLGWTKG